MKHLTRKIKLKNITQCFDAFLKTGSIFLASSGDEKVNVRNTLFASFPITANRVATWRASSSLSSFVAKV